MTQRRTISLLRTCMAGGLLLLLLAVCCCTTCVAQPSVVVTGLAYRVYEVNATHPKLVTAEGGVTVTSDTPQGDTFVVRIILCENSVRGADRMSVDLRNITFSTSNFVLAVSYVDDMTCDDDGERSVSDTATVDVSMAGIDLRKQGTLLVTGNMPHHSTLTLHEVFVARISPNDFMIRTVLSAFAALIPGFADIMMAQFSLASPAFLFGGGGSAIRGTVSVNRCEFVNRYAPGRTKFDSRKFFGVAIDDAREMLLNSGSQLLFKDTLVEGFHYGFVISRIPNITFTNGSSFVQDNCTIWSMHNAFIVDSITEAMEFSGGSSFLQVNSAFSSRTAYAFRMISISRLLVDTHSTLAQRSCSFSAAQVTVVFTEIARMEFLNGSLFEQDNCYFAATTSVAMVFSFIENFTFIGGSTFAQRSCHFSAPSYTFQMYKFKQMLFADGSAFLQDNSTYVATVRSNAVTLHDMQDVFFVGNSVLRQSNCTISCGYDDAMLLLSLANVMFAGHSHFEQRNCVLTAARNFALRFSSLQQVHFTDQSTFVLHHTELVAVSYTMYVTGVQALIFSDRSSFLLNGSSSTTKGTGMVGMIFSSIKRFEFTDMSVFGVVGGSRFSAHDFAFRMFGIENFTFTNSSALLFQDSDFIANGGVTAQAIGVTGIKRVVVALDSTIAFSGCSIAGKRFGFLWQATSMRFDSGSAFVVVDTDITTIPTFKSNAIVLDVQNELLFSNGSTLAIIQSTFKSRSDAVELVSAGSPALSGVRFIGGSLLLFRDVYSECAVENLNTYTVSLLRLRSGIVFDTVSLLHITRTSVNNTERPSGAVVPVPILRLDNKIHVLPYSPQASSTATTSTPLVPRKAAAVVIAYSYAPEKFIFVVGAGAAELNITSSRSSLDGSTTPIVLECLRNVANPSGIPVGDRSSSLPLLVPPLMATPETTTLISCNGSTSSTSSSGGGLCKTPDVPCFGPNTVKSSADVQPSENDDNNHASCSCTCHPIKVQSDQGKQEDDRLVTVVPSLPCRRHIYIRKASPTTTSPTEPPLGPSVFATQTLTVRASATPSIAIRGSSSPSVSRSPTPPDFPSISKSVSATVSRNKVQTKNAVRERKVTALVEFLGGEQTAEAVEASGTASAAVGGLVSPATAAYGSRVQGAQVLSHKCLVTDGGDDNDPEQANREEDAGTVEPPSVMELPAVAIFATHRIDPVALHGYVAVVMAGFLAAIAATVELLASRRVARWVSGDKPRRPSSSLSKQSKSKSATTGGSPKQAAMYAAMFSSVLLMFYALPIASSAVTAIVAHRTTPDVPVALCGVAALAVMLGNTAWIWYVVWKVVGRELAAAKQQRHQSDSGDSGGETQHYDDGDGGAAAEVPDDLFDEEEMTASDGGATDSSPTSSTTTSGGSNAAANDPVAAVYYDASRDVDRLVTRAYFVEELVVSLLLGIATGCATRRSSCISVTWALVVISAVHLGYVLGLRPYRSKIESAFVALQAVLQAAQYAVLAIGSSMLQNPDDDVSKRESLIKASGFFGVAANASLIGQAVVLAAWSLRRKAKKSENASSDADDGDGNQRPLLLDPSASAAAGDVTAGGTDTKQHRHRDNIGERSTNPLLENREQRDNER